jgi:hypothetical protein
LLEEPPTEIVMKVPSSAGDDIKCPIEQLCRANASEGRRIPAQKISAIHNNDSSLCGLWDDFMIHLGLLSEIDFIICLHEKRLQGLYHIFEMEKILR